MPCSPEHIAHNKIRHGKDGLNFYIGREDDTTDWAARTLADAARGHKYVSKTLTDRGKFGTNIGGRISTAKKKKKPKRKRDSTLEGRSTYACTATRGTNGRSSRT